MQIIENSIVGTRSAVLRLTRRGGGPAIVIFPMLHVADPRFFRAVESRLRECDLLVVEGIQGESAAADGLTATYRVMPVNEESGLVEDDIPYGDLGVPLVAPDLSGEEFQEGFQKLSWKVRALTWASVPVVSIGQFFAGRRTLLSPDIEVNDLPTAQDELRSEQWDDFLDLLLDRRDGRAVAAVAEVVRERGDEDIEVAVVYGARHVPGILRGLYGLGYRVVSADWLVVVSAQES
ncbi:hypothetical protein [Kribbella sp. VKM Ac-2566]|uniref:hypothetical protein n=1 Tax=Kribbella sp. VKM Ac-2566 TaxID=2512218 RepID=UPI0010626321|nr:hypothetical protein [Kribbella sp. VKM Ac-2566]TDW92424.1 hypothetical protein EV647_4262 [Kribbella sp. VKM Ac-2566]